MGFFELKDLVMNTVGRLWVLQMVSFDQRLEKTDSYRMKNLVKLND